MSKEYIKPKNLDEFYVMVSTSRGIKQTWLTTFEEVFENATSNMLELICKTKPFGIKTAHSIVMLGKKKQKKFLKWYLLGQEVKDIETGDIKYIKYPVKFVHLWVADNKA